MDTLPVPERTFLDGALDTLRAMGIAAEIVQAQPKLGRTQADALVRLTHGLNEALYAVEVKRAVRPATLGAALHHMERLGEQALLVTDYVTPQLAQTLKARKVPFIDAAGNAYLEHPGVLIWVTGQKPAAPAVPPPLGRAFQPTGLQVLFALLCDPKLIDRPYRELGELAGVAHGTVGWLIPELKQQGFVADLKGKRGTRRLFHLDRLLQQWVDAYARQLRPRLLMGRYHVAKLEGWRDWALAPHGALWGEEPAGALLTHHLRPETLTIYADKVPGVLAARQKFLKEPAPGHTAIVEVRRKFWKFAGEKEHPEITPPVLVYADLLANGDARCLETARIVYDAHVARFFRPE